MIQEKKFKKNKENFKCDNCDHYIEGDGYTNHCSECLCSKHVDINPGDRKCECKGMMTPVGLENKDGIFYIVHKCKRCDFERRNKASKGDNFQKLIEISNLGK